MDLSKKSGNRKMRYASWRSPFVNLGTGLRGRLRRHGSETSKSWPAAQNPLAIVFRLLSPKPTLSSQESHPIESADARPLRGPQLDDSPLQTDDYRVRSIVGLEFCENALDSRLHGILGDVELIGNLF
jgi:hypothetical protein